MGNQASIDKSLPPCYAATSSSLRPLPCSTKVRRCMLMVSVYAFCHSHTVKVQQVSTCPNASSSAANCRARPPTLPTAAYTPFQKNRSYKTPHSHFTAIAIAIQHRQLQRHVLYAICSCGCAPSLSFCSKEHAQHPSHPIAQRPALHATSSGCAAAVCTLLPPFQGARSSASNSPQTPSASTSAP